MRFANESDPKIDPTDADDDLFAYLRPSSSTSSPLAEQLNEYLTNKSTDLNSLQIYPAIKMAFVKANSTLPSSAAVERLFSAAGQILSSRRCKMSDEHFDKLVFLRDYAKNLV